MAGSTTNYGLTKPATGEAYDVNVPNGNMDIVDRELKRVDNKVKAVQVGTVTVSVANATAAGSITVTFPTAFSAPPTVVLTKGQVSGAASSMRKLQPVVTAITATDFVANLETADGANVGAAFNVPCTWIAVLT